MSLYDGIKDVAKIVQQADNIDLYRQLLDLGAQALEMQNKIVELTLENKQLKDNKKLEEDIERHSELFVTLKSDTQKIKYCSHCWDAEQKLIQINCNGNGLANCPHCKNSSPYDRELYNNNYSFGDL